jgi:ribonuclease HII
VGPAFDRPFRERYGVVAGVDEVGRGPLAGPVVAAAVIFSEGYVLRGLNDSKQLSPQERETLFSHIQRIALTIGVGVVEADQVDALNIFQANTLAMQKALNALSVRPTFTLIDGRPLKRLPYAHQGVVGGDGKSALIAAASIIAKVTRDRMMVAWHEKYPMYEFHRHKGYGTKLHLERLKAHGPCPIHRRSFAPVTALLHLLTE